VTPPTVALLVLTPTVVAVEPDPIATLFGFDALVFKPMAIVLVPEATALFPIAIEDAPAALVPPNPAMMELVPVAVPVASAVVAAKYGMAKFPVTVRLLIFAFCKYAAVFT